MVDFKKEIRLSDLVPKRKAKKKTAPLSASPNRKERRGRGPAQLVGLKVGSSQLCAAVVTNNGGVKLSKLVREPLQPGIVSGGEVRDRAALAAALEGFFGRHELPRRGVRLGLASTRVGVRAFDISGIDDDKQLANAIAFRALETLPVPSEDAVSDYQVLSESIDDDGVRTCRALLVVAYRELVDGYAEACTRAKIELVGIDLEAFALLRALGAPAAEGEVRAEGAVVALSVGHGRSTLAVSDGRTCEFTRVLDWGGVMLTAAIAAELATTEDEAEEIKRNLSLDPAGEHEPERVTRARAAVQKALQRFARELVSSLQFYQAQAGSLPIGELVLTGGTADLDGLAAELERLIGVRTRVADPLARVELAKGADLPAATGSTAIAIGLGIED